MAFNLHVSDQANADVTDAVDYYDKINPALGSRFLIELQSAYEKIKANPQHYSFISVNPEDKFRDIKLNVFPYVVIYEVHKTDIYVSAVMHTRRKPFYPKSTQKF